MRVLSQYWIPTPEAGAGNGIPAGVTNLIAFDYLSPWYELDRLAPGITFDLFIVAASGTPDYTLTLQGSNAYPPPGVDLLRQGQPQTQVPLFASTSTSVGLGFLTDTTSFPDGVPDGFFVGQYLQDSAGDQFQICAMDADTSTYSLSPSVGGSVTTPVAGAYSILQNGSWIPPSYTVKTLKTFQSTQALVTDPVQQQPLSATIDSVGITSLTANFPLCRYVRALLTYNGSGVAATGSITVADNDIATSGTGSTNAWTDTTGAAKATSAAFTVANTDIATTGVVTGSGPTYTWTDAGSTFTSALQDDTLIDGAGLPWTVAYVSAHVLTLSGNFSAATSGSGVISHVRVGDQVDVSGNALYASLVVQDSGHFVIGSDTTTAANIGTAIAANTAISALVTESVTTNVVTLTAVNYGTAGNSIPIVVSTAVSGSITATPLAGGAQGPFSSSAVGWTLVDHSAVGWTITSVSTDGTVLTVVGTPTGSSQTGTVSSIVLGSTLSVGGISLTAIGTGTASASEFRVAAYETAATHIGAAMTANTAIAELVTNSVATNVVSLTAVVPGAAGDSITLTTSDAPSYTIAPMSGGSDITGAFGGTVYSQGSDG